MRSGAYIRPKPHLQFIILLNLFESYLHGFLETQFSDRLPYAERGMSDRRVEPLPSELARQGRPELFMWTLNVGRNRRSAQFYQLEVDANIVNSRTTQKRKGGGEGILPALSSSGHLK